MRNTRTTAAVVAAFNAEPGKWQYGYDLTKRLGIKGGTLYPILARLVAEGVIEVAVDVRTQNGPTRRYYRLCEPTA